MKLSLVKSDVNRNLVSMAHRDEVILWNVSSFDRTELDSGVDVFKQLNNYWAQLTSEQQTGMFEVYRTIRGLLDNAVSLDTLTLQLQKQVAVLLDEYHDLEVVQHWMDFKSDVIMPTSVPVSVNFDEGSPATEEKTYIQKDYRKLVALSIALRAMIPIWGEFIFRIRGESGTAFKEYSAKWLLNHSKIVNSDAILKLESYIQNQLPADNTVDGAILGGIGSLNYPGFIMSRVLVRRLCIGDITGINPQSTLLTFIYKFIRNPNSGQTSGKKSGLSRGIGDNIREKFRERSLDGEDGENKLSKFESYKIQEDMSRGDIVTLRYYVSNPYVVAKKIEPNLDLTLLEESLKSVQVLQAEFISPAQITLLQWVLKPAISPKGLGVIPKPDLLKAIAVVQAVLWFRGHKELAALCSAYVYKTQEHQIMTVESRARITKELQEELRFLFPFHRRYNGRSKSSKPVNPAIVSIDLVSDGLTEREWVLTIPDHWIKTLDDRIFNRRFAAPFDIKIKLASLVCQLVRQSAVV